MSLALRLALGGLVAAGLLWLWPSLPDLQSDLTRLHDMLQHGQGWRARNPVPAALAYLAAFVLLASLPLPVIIVMTLAGGAFFGFWLGLVLSIAGTVGASMLTFWVARHLLGRRLRRMLGPRADALDRRVERDGGPALLTLRLTPGLPFFVLNLVAGVSVLRARVFALVTALGVIPSKAIVAAAGTQLAEIDHISDLVGPRVIAVVVALALFPWVARWISHRLRGGAPAG